MKTHPEIEAFILVGGKSSRMGRDKALLEISGRPLAGRMAAVAAPLVSAVRLVGEERRGLEFGLPVVIDRWPGAGPLGAIAAALLEAKAPWALILACDLPYVEERWLESLCERAFTSEPNAVDAIVPAGANGLEPLCAMYRAAAGLVLAKAVESGVRKVTNGLALLKIESVPESEWGRFSPEGKLFRNLNTWQDYLDARNDLERANRSRF